MLRAQTRELVIGGAASHKPWVETHVMPFFEKKYNCRINFEGTRSLVNLEKMQKNKDKPYLSIVQMDDPVMILAVREGLLEPITAAKVPNVAKLKPGSIHMDGMWANYLQPWQGIAYNTNVLKEPPKSWAEIFEPKFKGRIIVPSLQNTEGLPNLFMMAHLQTGKPMAEAYKDIDAAFTKLKALKPNLLTAYSQMPQAFSLLEQGEAHMIVGALSSFGMQRRLDGAPVGMTAPAEGIFPVPSGIAIVKGAPTPTSPTPTSTSCWAPRCRRRSRRRPSRCRPTSTRPCRPACRPTPRSIRSTGPSWRRTATNGSSAGTARWRSERHGYRDVMGGPDPSIHGLAASKKRQGWPDRVRP